MVQLPAAEKPTGNPDEAVALTLKVASPMVFAASGLKVMVWPACPMVKVCGTSAAGWYFAARICEGVMVHDPPLTMWTELPDTLQAVLVVENDTGKPEDAVALTVKSGSPKVLLA